MLEQFEKPLRPPQRGKPPEEQRKEDEMSEADELAIYAAKDFQLKLPRVGSPAFRRVIETALEYAQRVRYQEESAYIASLPDGDARRQIRSDRERRALHEILCRFLLDKEHSKASDQERNRVSNFALTIAKLEKYFIS